MKKLVRIGMMLFVILIWAGFAQAAPSSLTYQGRILKTDGTPLEASSVSFQFEVTSPDGLCILYREQVNGISMVNSGGVFDIPIGALGTQSYPGNGTFTLLDAFTNSGTLNCDGGSPFNPQFDDGRKLRVKFHDGSGWKTISPDSTIRSVPYAGYSYSAAKLGTNIAADFLLKAGIPTCAPGTFLSWNGSALACAAVAGASGGTVTEVTSKNSYLTIIDSTSSPALTLNVGTSANTVAAGNDPRFSDGRTPIGAAGGDLSGTYPNPSVVKIQGHDISNVAPAAGEFFKFAAGKWTSSVIDISDVNNLSSAMSGYQTTAAFNTAVGGANCANYETPYWSSVAGKFLCQAINVSVAGDISGSIGAVSVDKIKGVSVGPTAPTTGQVLKYDGVKWAPAADNNAGGTVTNVTASAPLSVATGTSTPAISISQATNATDGYLSSSDWNTFNNKLAKTLTTGKIWVGVANIPNEVSVTGDATLASSGALTLANTAVTPNSYGSASSVATFTVDGKGRLTAASSTPIAIPWSAITSGMPNSLSGYGIADAVQNIGGTPSIKSGLDAAKGAATTAGRLYVATDTFKIYRDNGSSWDLIASAAGAGGTVMNVTSGNSYLSVATGTTTPALTLNVGTTANTVAAGNDTRIVNAVQNTSTTKGDLIAFDGTNNVRLPVGANGQVLTADSTASTGVKWSAAGTVTSVTGTLPVVVTSATSTPQISVNDATTSTKGIVQVGSGLSVTGGVISTTGAAPTGSAGGDLSGTYPNPTVSKLNNTALSISSLTTSQYLKYDGTNWVNSVIAIGDVTGLSTSLSGKPDFTQFPICTAAQTLTFVSPVGGFVCSSIAIGDAAITYASKAANTFLAAPSGSAGAPSFRTLASADLPAGGYDTTYFKQGGNSFGANATLGTSDNKNLILKTNNTTRMTILNTGSVGFGTQALSWYDVSLYKADADANMSVVSENTSTTTARYPALNVVNYAGSPATGAAGVPSINLINMRGTTGVSAVMKSGEVLGSVAFNGSTNTAGGYKTGASIVAQTAQDLAPGAVGTDLYFQTTALNSSSNLERMRLTAAGNLGIGTATPLSKLDVSGGVAVGTFAGVSAAPSNGLSVSGTIFAGQVTGQTGLYNQYTSTYNFNPRLQISGTSADGASAALMSFQSNPAGPNLVLAHTRGDTLGSQTILQSGDEIGGVSFQASDGSTGFLQAAKIKSSVTGTPAVGDIASNIIFQTRPAAGTLTSRMIIDSTGYVGIGTTSPTQALTVNGNFLLSNTGSRIIGDYSNTTVANRAMFQTSTTDSNTVVGAIPNNTGGTNANPGSGFQVYNNSNPANAAVGMFAADQGLVYLSSAISGSGTYLPMGFNTGGAERMRISTTGNIGIGISAPTTKLYIANAALYTPTANNTAALTLQGSYGGGLVLQDGSYSSTIYTTTNGSTLVFNAGGTAAGVSPYSMSLTSVGNLTTAGCITYNGGTSGTCLSDRRLKKDIRPFNLGLDKVLGIQPVFYKYNGLGGNQEDSHDRLGVIAQEVEKVAPEIVENREVKIHESDKETTTVRVVNYSAFTYMLMNAIKEFYHEFTGTKVDVAALKEANQKQQRDIASLVEENAKLKKMAEKSAQENAEIKARLERIEQHLNSK